MHCLNRVLIACALVSGAGAAAYAKVDRVVDKSFQVQPGVHLTVSTSGGEIRVDPSEGSTVRVLAKERIHASSDAEADKILQDLELTIEQRGNEIVATAHYAHGSGWHFGFWPPVEVDFVITAPRDASGDLKTSGGDITVGDLGGNLKAHTSGGEIKLGKMGAEVDASTSGGDVVLEEAAGKTRLDTSGGNISVGRVAGPAELRTSGGDIRVESVDNILDAETSGGNVKASFKGALKGDCRLSTSGGEVKATIGRNVGLRLDAKTSGGDVNAAGVTIRVDHGGVGKSSLSGDVNGGGPLLKLRTSGGDIDLIERSE
jgi:DUF4097 and DUF4098 domain-containing protein YvlB